MRILWSPFLALLVVGGIACASAAPEDTPDISATITAGVTAQVRAHLDSLPAATPLPTGTPYPTATHYPTNTPRPTATQYPTSTPRPTATQYPTPRPTRTPLPTATPTPSVKWGLANAPLTVKDIADSTLIQRGQFILRGCFTGIKTDSGGASGYEYVFSERGGSSRNTDYVAVIGFPSNTNLKTSGCYLMAVRYVKSETYCYYSSYLPVPPFGCPSNSWDYNTPIFRLINSTTFEQAQ